MGSVIVGGVVGYGIAIAAFYIFRWADNMFVTRADIVEHGEPQIRKAA
jgi:hypothetical protein